MIIAYVALELTRLVLVTAGTFHATGLLVAASVLTVVSGILMIAVSVVDHSRSPRPSVLLNGYLFLTLLLDATQTRTLYLSADNGHERTYASLFSASTALKAGSLLLEAHQKTGWVTWNRKEHSPEETSSIFSLGVFFWVNKIFISGYRKVLTIEDLFPLDSAFNAELLHDKFRNNMNYSRLKTDGFGLAKVLMHTLKVPLFLPIFPRLALLGFTFCQPFFIERLLDTLTESKIDANVGYGLIGASFLIYSGMAVSMALTWYSSIRATNLLRY